MKKSICRFCCICLCFVLFLTGTVPLSAAEEIVNPVRFSGFSLYAAETGGLRATFALNRPLLEKRYETEGKVAFGAVVGIAGEDLGVTGSMENGFSAVSPRAWAVCVYATGAPAYADGCFLNEEKTTFSLVALADTGADEVWEAKIAFRAFFVYRDGDGNETVLYTDAADALLGKPNSLLGENVGVEEYLRYETVDCPYSLQKYDNLGNEDILSLLAQRGIPAPARGEVLSVRMQQMGAWHIAAEPVRAFVNQARRDYVTDAYADYTTSVVQDYSRAQSNFDDRPCKITLRWDPVTDVSPIYTIYLSTSPDFAPAETRQIRVENNTGVYDLYNLHADTTYYWKVSVKTFSGHTAESEVLSFRTENEVRWIYADGVRNVRDIGGWNGLNQGMVYRGSELNRVSTHNLQLTADGLAVMHDVLGIRTDMDFRAAGEDCGNITFSPLGKDVRYARYSIGGYMNIYNADRHDLFAEFADPRNYPFYLHCWGGADRTGSAAFVLEALCGVPEEDLAIDFELTSFAYFGDRYRYDNGSYLYASMLARMKTNPGRSLAEQTEYYLIHDLGLTRAQVSNIRSLLSGGKETFYIGADADETTRALVSDAMESGTVEIRLSCPGRQTVSSMRVKGETFTGFSFNAQTGILTLDAFALEETAWGDCLVEIVFSDGTVLTTDIRVLV